MTSQLADLARPFPASFVHANPSGGSYVEHGTIVQRLLYVLGPFSFSLREIIRGDVPGVPPNPDGSSERAKRGTPDLVNVVVGAICTLQVTIDSEFVRVDEIGDCEQPHNWPHDGARMKDAMSDAIKRCAMRLGLGLHLWAQDEYHLDSWLAKRANGDGGGERPDTPPPPPPNHPEVIKAGKPE